MNSRLLITMLCLAAVALACGSLTNTDVARLPSHGTPKTDGIVSAPAVDGNFVMKVEPHALRFALNVTNPGKKHIELAFPNGQQYEFSVKDSIGREVYRWSTGHMFTQSVQNRVIDGGDVLHIEQSAVTTLPRGKYVAVATLRSSNFPISRSSTFELR